MEKLLRSLRFREAWELVVQEIEDDPEGKEDLRELFSFVLTTYW